MNIESDDLSIYNAEGTALRVLQLKMLHILETVTSIADRHNLPYWLSGGTLLGAVRHGGFIPWDDDIDIELMRSDYKKLLRILPQELPAEMYLQTPKERAYPLLFAKVRDRNSIVHSPEEDCAHYKEKGYFIDIFPEERAHKPLRSFIDFFHGRAFRRLKRGQAFHSFKFFFEFSISLFIYPVSTAMMWFARSICAITRPSSILHSYGIPNTTKHDASYMFPQSKIMFEGKLFSAPADPNAYLTKQYGDYMKIPSKEGRATHFMSVEYK